jgi:hypothetical protein
VCQYAAVPRWKDDDDRGEFGAWLSAQVGDRTFDWLAAEMAKRGHVHGADYYRAMASGNKPAGRVIGRALREYFGAPPKLAPARTGATETPDALIRAIEAQTEAITGLVTKLDLIAGAVEELLAERIREAMTPSASTAGSR